MARYFKMVEISENEYEEETGEVFDDCWCQSINPVNGAIYIAVDDEEYDEIEINIEAIERAFEI